MVMSIRVGSKCTMIRVIFIYCSNDVIIWGMSWGEPESGTPACTVVNFSVEDDEIQAAKNHVLHCCCTDR